MTYSYEKRKNAVELYIKYEKKAAPVVAELGYPNRHSLRNWYQDYLTCGKVREAMNRKPKFSDEQKKTAVKHYLEHGKNMAFTMRELGYPGSKEYLANWIDDYAPGERRRVVHAPADLTYDKQIDVVMALESRTKPAAEVASELGTTRVNLYQLKYKYLGNGAPTVKGKPSDNAPDQVEVLLSQVTDLQAQVRDLELRKDILEGAVRLLGKTLGTDPKRLPNREKTLLINTLRDRWPLSMLLDALEMHRSSYHYQVASIGRGDKLAGLRVKVKKSFKDNGAKYGRRRIHDELATEGVVVGERVISKIMRQEGLEARGSKRKRRSYSSYEGEISQHPGNRVNRDFRSGLPNFLWLSDVTQFTIPAGKVYLSPVLDCFDGMIVSWTLSESPNAEMVNTMLLSAIASLKRNESSVIHTDCGCHYRWPGWISICEQHGLIRSMSKKGCSPDNSAMEGFFGRLKNEMFYERDWSGVTIEAFMREVDEYIQWYNAKGDVKFLSQIDK